MRVALLGGGTIGRLVGDHIRQGRLPGAELVAVAGRSETSAARRVAEELGAAYTARPAELADYRPDVILEAASHQAVRDYVEGYLTAGVDVIVMSSGALADDDLRARLLAAAEARGALLWVPSGGIGGLDALKAATLAGVERSVIEIRKPPRAWKGVSYVDDLGVDLDGLQEPYVLYAGPTRQGVVLFPQNVNIAASLSLAGIGFERTELRVVADPTISRNVQVIEVEGRTGRFTVTLENVPSPDNPRTSSMACHSALAALAHYRSSFRVGT